MFYTPLGEELERGSEMCTVVQTRKGGEKIYIQNTSHIIHASTQTCSHFFHRELWVSISREQTAKNENQELLLLRFYDNVLQHFPVFVFNVLN